MCCIMLFLISCESGDIEQYTDFISKKYKILDTVSDEYGVLVDIPDIYEFAEYVKQLRSEENRHSMDVMVSVKGENKYPRLSIHDDYMY